MVDCRRPRPILRKISPPRFFIVWALDQIENFRTRPVVPTASIADNQFNRCSNYGVNVGCRTKSCEPVWSENSAVGKVLRKSGIE